MNDRYTELAERIATAFAAGPDKLHHDATMRKTVLEALDLLETGQIRAAEPDGQGGYVVQAWVKQAVLLCFRLFEQTCMPTQLTTFFDRIPLRHQNWTEAEFRAAGYRAVPGALVRRGAHVGRDVVLMPSFINIGAHVGQGTMVDTWATIGSCAQIGARCHISGGVGIGGVLEPLQAQPTIIEDDCFIGARSEIAEGMRVGQGSVIAMGVFLGQSTKLFHRERNQLLPPGLVPPYSVVVPGTLPAADGSHSLACAVIVKQVDAQTRSKTALNELLRDANP